MKLQRKFRLTETDGQPTPETQNQKPQEIKAEDILTHLGFKKESIKTLDDFKTELNQNFIRRDQEIIRGDSELYSKLMGSKTKGTMVAAQRALRENSVPFTEDDLKEPKLETFVESMISRAAKLNQEKVTKLEAQLASSNTGTDEKVTRLQSELEATTAKLTEATNKLTVVETDWQKKLQQKEVEFENLNKKTAWAKEIGSFKWAAGVDDLKKEGFISRVEKNFDFKFDENGKYIPFDKQGNKVPNPAVKDTFYDAEGLLKAEGIKAGVYAINPHTGKGGTPEKKKETPAKPSQDGQPSRVNTLRPAIAVRK